MATTLNDIAEKSGLSVSTVSRVLNNQARKYRISEKAARLVMQTAAELNYRPNPLARGLKLKKTHTIGLVVPDISNPFFAHIVKSIQRIVHEMDYSLVVCDTDEALEMEEEHVELLYSKSVDGLIVMPVGQSWSHLHAIKESGLPLVLVDRSFDELEVDSVVVDNFRGAFDATSHLTEMGHERIAVLQGLPGTYTNTGRLAGYRSALEQAGIDIDDRLIVGKDFRKESGYIETKLLLNLMSPPTAIFAFGDLITFGALEAIYEERLSVPEDISLVTFDDIDFAPFLTCPLTAVAQPRRLIGEMAVKLLSDRISKPGGDPQRIVLKLKFIRRQSVARLNSPAAGHLVQLK